MAAEVIQEGRPRAHSPAKNQDGYVYLDVHKFQKWASRPCQNLCQDCQTLPLNQNEPQIINLEDKRICIFGYEPFLHKKIFAYLKHIRSFHPRQICVVTNGFELGQPGFAEQLLGIENLVIIIKLFGSNSLEHEQHTAQEGSFDKAVKAIITLRSLKIKTLVTYPRLDVLAEDKKVFSEILNLAYSLTNTWPVLFPRREGESPLQAVSPQDGEMRKGEKNQRTPVIKLDMLLARNETVPQRWRQGLYPIFHLLTGPFCNIRCSYCNVVGGDKETQQLYELAQIQQNIEYAAEVAEREKLHAPTLDFIGGEPTMHPRLPQLIEIAKNNGFKKITICTNGLRLAQDGYLEKLIEAGLTGVRFSFHSHLAEEAENLADRKQSGKKYIKVAELLLNQRLVESFFYRIMLAPTMASLREYFFWLLSHNQTGRPLQLILGMPSLRGRMFYNETLFPDLKEAREQAIWLYQQSQLSKFVDFSVHHAPGCLVPEDETIAAESFLMAKQTDSQSKIMTVLNFEGNTQYASACQKCRFYNTCPGLPAYYFRKNKSQAEAWVKPFI